MTVDHPMYIHSTIYINIDGVYMRTKNVDEEGPLCLRILEDEYKPIPQTEFYFADAVKFEAKANHSYHFNFINSDKHRIIIIQMTQVIESAKVEKNIKSSDFESFKARAVEFKDDVMKSAKTHHETTTLEFSNRKALTESLRTYSYYMMGETVVVAVLCLLQVEGIRKMLSSSSVV